MLSTRTALKKTLSYRVLCFAKPCSSMEIATSRGVSVLAVFMMGVLRRGSDAASRSRLVLYRRMWGIDVNICRRNEKKDTQV